MAALVCILTLVCGLAGCARGDVLGTSSSFRMPALDYTPKNMIDIRALPDGMSNIILSVPEDAEISILGTEGSWYYVSAEGITGYIFGGDIQGDETHQIDLSAVEIYAFSSRRENMTEGEPVYLTCRVTGAEGYELSYQWQVSKGGGFEDVPGATSSTWSFNASVETLAWNWKVLVYAKVPQ